MPVLATLAALSDLLPAEGRCLGLDVGTKTIGVACSDLSRRVATPHSTIRRKTFKADGAALLALIAETSAQAIIVGLPLNMNGTEGPRAQSTRAFARNLAGLTSVPITFWDERLSTAAVTRSLLEADASRARRAEVVDKLAAAYILQGALDRLAGPAGL